MGHPTIDGDRFDLESGISRRSLLSNGAKGAVLLGGLGSVVAACGGGSLTATDSGTTANAGVELPSGTGGGVPVRGGTMRIGGLSGGSTESLNPLFALSNIDVIVSMQIFDQLFNVSSDLKKLEPRLALSAEPNKTATEWVVKLRPGVTWHDGSPLTADDVIYSMNYWANPEGQAAGLAAVIDLKRLRKEGDLTVRVPLKSADAAWPYTVTGFVTPIIKAGTAEASFNKNPIGTGPFKFSSFAPGRELVLVKNPNFWDHGKPYLDKLQYVTSFTEDNARLNALLSGQVDLMPLAEFQVAKNEINSDKVTVFGATAPQPYIFVMRVDKGPLADPKVRKAMKLMVDRQGLIDGAISGFGQPGNDLLGTGTRYFADDLVVEQDVEQAKSLFKAAGKAGETFTLQTSNITPGFIQAGTLFAQQAKAAGISIDVQQIDPSNYYLPSGGFLSAPFRQTYYLPWGALDTYYIEYLTPESLNESFWGSQPGGEKSIQRIGEARAATKPALAEELWHEVQKEQFEDGGLLVWANADYVSIAGSNVRGVSESPRGFLNNGNLSEAWIEDE